MNEEIIAKGKIFELVHLPQPDGRVFEVARRAPGVRIIIADKEKRRLLLTREFRRELNDWDYRLPGGKVFDTLDEYEQHRASSDDILQVAIAKVKGEASEEAAVAVDEVKHVATSTLGATVEWNLYVFEALDWHEKDDGQNLEAGEDIEISWYDYDEVRRMILGAKMQEDRIAMVLLRWLEKQ